MLSSRCFVYACLFVRCVYVYVCLFIIFSDRGAGRLPGSPLSSASPAAPRTPVALPSIDSFSFPTPHESSFVRVSPTHGTLSLPQSSIDTYGWVCFHFFLSDFTRSSLICCCRLFDAVSPLLQRLLFLVRRCPLYPPQLIYPSIGAPLLHHKVNPPPPTLCLFLFLFYVLFFFVSCFVFLHL